MAFVFRSSRSNDRCCLQQSSQCKCTDDSETREQTRSTQAPKRPLNGLAYRIMRPLPSNKLQPSSRLDKLDSQCKSQIRKYSKPFKRLLKSSYMFASASTQEPLSNLDQNHLLPKAQRRNFVINKIDVSPKSNFNSFLMDIIANKRPAQVQQHTKVNKSVIAALLEQRDNNNKNRIESGQTIEVRNKGNHQLINLHPQNFLQAQKIMHASQQLQKHRSPQLGLLRNSAKKQRSLKEINRLNMVCKVSVLSIGANTSQKCQKKDLQGIQKDLQSILSDESGKKTISRNVGEKKQISELQKMSRLAKESKVEIQKDNECNTSSSYSTEYKEDAIPGPGSYDWSQEKKDYRSRKLEYRRIFISGIKRFHEQSVECQDVTYFNQGQTNFKKQKNKHSFFISKTPKIMPLACDWTPGPGYYETRKSLENDILNRIMYSAKSDVFINKQSRTRPEKKHSPGPAQQIPKDIFKEYSRCKVKPLSSKKSSPCRFEIQDLCIQKKRTEDVVLKYQIAEQQILSDQQVSLIHTKKNKKQEYYFVESPPFLSGTERFNNLNKQSDFKQIVTKKDVQKNLQRATKQPFSCSGARKLECVIGEGVGVGLYDVEQSMATKKQSFNVLFN